MKKTLTLSIVLTLALAGTAFADYGSSSHYYPEYREMKKVKYLAHELYKGAHYLHEHAARYAPRYTSYGEREAIEDLYRLAKRADNFYEQVGRYYREPRRTEREFRRLVRAYRVASRGFHELSTYRRYHEDFECLIETMDKLAHYYGGYAYHEAGYRRGYDDGYGRGWGDRRRSYREPKAIHIARGAYHILRALEDHR